MGDSDVRARMDNSDVRAMHAPVASFVTDDSDDCPKMRAVSAGPACGRLVGLSSSSTVESRETAEGGGEARGEAGGGDAGGAAGGRFAAARCERRESLLPPVMRGEVAFRAGEAEFRAADADGARAASLSAVSLRSSSSSYAQVSMLGVQEPLPSSLYRLLYPHRVQFAELVRRHPAYETILRLVRSLIGVAPNCAPIMEMWPPAFATYNLLVPNMLNLPFFLWGVAAPRQTVGLAMYYSSRGHGCMYCSLHSCSFSLRRGLSPETLQGARMSKTEAAVARMAYNLSSIPCRLTDADRDDVRRDFAEHNVEWIVMGVAMMGFLNRWMDLTNVDMEDTVVGEVASTLMTDTAAWSPGVHSLSSPQDPLQNPGSAPPKRKDSLVSNLSLFKFFPTVIKYDAELTKNVPRTWPEVGKYLHTTTGHSWPILGRLKHTRPVVAIAKIISSNLNVVDCSIDLELKYFSGMIFAGRAKNRLLFEEFRKIALDMSPELLPETLEAVSEYAWDDSPESLDFSSVNLDHLPLRKTAGLSYSDELLLVFAKAGSCNPPQTPPIILEIADTLLTPPQVVEMITWLSVCNMLHRLYCFYLPGSYDGARVPFDDADPTDTKIFKR